MDVLAVLFGERTGAVAEVSVLMTPLCMAWSLWQRAGGTGMVATDGRGGASVPYLCPCPPVFSCPPVAHGECHLYCSLAGGPPTRPGRKESKSPPSCPSAELLIVWRPMVGWRRAASTLPPVPRPPMGAPA